MRRGEVWLCTLDPTVGTEIQKTRPCLIVSPDGLNAMLRRVIVAPMTGGSHPAPFRVPVTFQGKPGLILPDQLRTQDAPGEAPGTDGRGGAGRDAVGARRYVRGVRARLVEHGLSASGSRCGYLT